MAMGNLMVHLGLDNSAMKKGLDDSREHAKGFMYSLSKFGGVGSGPAALLGLSGPAATAAEVGALVGIVVAGLNQIKQARQKAMEANISMGSFLGVEKSIKGTSTNLDQMLQIIGKSSQSVEEAINGNEEFKKSFERLGLSAKNLYTMNTEQRFATIAEAIGKTGSKTEQSAIAMKILGEEAGKSLPALLEAGKAMREQQKYNIDNPNLRAQGYDFAGKEIAKGWDSATKGVSEYGTATIAALGNFYRVYKAVIDAPKALSESIANALGMQNEGTRKAAEDYANTIHGISTAEFGSDFQGARRANSRRKESAEKVAEIEKDINNYLKEQGSSQEKVNSLVDKWIEQLKKVTTLSAEDEANRRELYTKELNAIQANIDGVKRQEEAQKALLAINKQLNDEAFEIDISNLEEADQWYEKIVRELMQLAGVPIGETLAKAQRVREGKEGQTADKLLQDLSSKLSDTITSESDKAKENAKKIKENIDEEWKLKKGLITKEAADRDKMLKEYKDSVQALGGKIDPAMLQKIEDIYQSTSSQARGRNYMGDTSTISDSMLRYGAYMGRTAMGGNDPAVASLRKIEAYNAKMVSWASRFSLGLRSN